MFFMDYFILGRNRSPVFNVFAVAVAAASTRRYTAAQLRFSWRKTSHLSAFPSPGFAVNCLFSKKMKEKVEEIFFFFLIFLGNFKNFPLRIDD